MEAALPYSAILYEVDGPIAKITLNRPEALNALNSVMRDDMDLALATIEQDQDIRVLVITGAGSRAFSAGGDIKEQVATADLTPEERILRQAQSGGSYVLKLATLRVPTIGAINGIAWGGAALLSSALDMRVGCEKTNFRFLAATYGQANSTWSLPLVVSLPKAKELMFTGREVHAEEALEIGLLNKLVPSEHLMEEAMEMAGMIANSHPVMVQGIRKLLTQGIGTGLADRWQLERDAVTSWMRSVPPREGFSEFLARKGA